MPLPPPTVEELYLDYPGPLDEETPDRVQRAIDKAVQRVRREEFAEVDYPTAVAYLALHLLVSNPLPSIPSEPATINGIPVDTIKQIELADELSVTFKTDKEITSTSSTSDSGDGTLASTRWGRMYLELRQMTITSEGGLSYGRNYCESLFEQGFRQVGGY